MEKKKKRENNLNLYRVVVEACSGGGRVGVL
jgi:hypothetical protein